MSKQLIHAIFETESGAISLESFSRGRREPRGIIISKSEIDNCLMSSITLNVKDLVKLNRIADDHIMNSRKNLRYTKRAGWKSQGVVRWPTVSGLFKVTGTDHKSTWRSDEKD